MGPGVHHAPDNTIHVRLQPTANNTLGIIACAGETDPNMLGLSLAGQTTAALTVRNCRHLVVRGLTLRFGGRTLQVTLSQNVTFDRVHIFAGPTGVNMGGNGAGSTQTVY